MPVPNQLAQIGHACLIAGDRFPQPQEPSNIVILGVDGEDALTQAIERIRGHGIQIAWFEETEYPQGVTAACTEPVVIEQRKVFKRYSLWS